MFKSLAKASNGNFFWESLPAIINIVFFKSVTSSVLFFFLNVGIWYKNRANQLRFKSRLSFNYDTDSINTDLNAKVKYGSVELQKLTWYDFFVVIERWHTLKNISLLLS